MKITFMPSVIKKWHILTLFCGIISIILLRGYFFYTIEEKTVREEKHNEIKAIANMKVGQMRQWRKERIGDATITAQVKSFVHDVNQWLNNRKNLKLETEIMNYLLPVKNNYGYENILLSSASGELLFSIDPENKKFDPSTVKKIMEAKEGKQIVFTDFYFCPDHKKIHLDIIAPVIDNKNNSIAALVFRIDPNEFLFPLIQSWPTPSKTSETLLIRQEGDSVLYLNELRLQKNTALNLRAPLTKKDVPAVQAVLGSKGLFEGNDYRGIPVLANIEPVPDTPWFIVAKVDKSEIFADFQSRSILIGLFTMVLVLFIGVGLMLMYRSRQKNIYKELLAKEKELWANQEEYKTTLYSIGDAVITTDVKGAIRYMNSVAEQLTGWQETKAKGTSIEKVFMIIDEDTRKTIENPVDKVLKEGITVALANHTLLISRKGIETPIADSGAPIKNDSGEITGVVLVFRNQTEERRKIKELFESKENFRSIFKNNSAAIAIIEPDTTISMVNEAYCQLSGYTEEEVVGMSWTRQIHPDDLERLKEYNRRRLLNPDDAPEKYEFKFYRKDGDVRYGLMSVAMIESSQKIVTSFIDISERKKAEEELRQSEMRFATLSDAAFEGIAISDKGQLIDCNEQLMTMMGYERSEMIGNDVSSFVAPESKQKVLEHVRSGSNEPYEHLALRKDGTIFPVEIRAKSLPVKGKPMRVTVIRDITERKRAEDVIRVSEARLRRAEIASKSGNWELHIGSKIMIGSEGAIKLYGVDKDKFEYAIIKNIPLPEYRPSLDVALKNLIEDNKPYDVEFKIKTFDTNEIKDIHSVAIFDKEKRILFGIIQDITDRKQMEGTLRASEEKYRSIYENVQDVYYEATIEGMILEISPSIELVSKRQYKRDDLIGKSMFEFYPNAGERQALLAELQKQGSVSDFAITLKNRDGSFVPCSISSKICFDTNGQPEKIIGSMRDVTERKRAEEALRESEERLSSFMNSAIESFYLLDADLNFIEINKKGLEIIGIKRENIIGKNIVGIIPDIKESHRYKKYLEVIKTGTPFIVDDLIHHPIFGDMHFNVISFKVGNGLGLIAHDITDRKLAELSLMHSEAQHTAFMNFIPALVLIKDHDLRLIYANKTYKQFFPADDWMGKKPHEIFPPEISDSMVAADTDALEKGFTAYEENWIDQQGNLHIFFTQKFRIDILDKEPLLGAIISDITERKQMEEELAKNETLVRTVVDNLPLIFYMIGRDGKFKFSIGAGLKGLGLKPNQVVGQSAFDIYKDFPEIIDSIKKSLAGEPATFETTIAGSTYNNFLAPIPPLKGSAAGIIGVALDITEQKILQHELFQMQKMDSIGTLAGGIAHDFNNILGIILGYSSMMERAAGENEKILEYIRIIVQAVNRGAALVRQILTFARKTDMTLAPVNLSDLINEIVSMLSQTFPKVITFKGIVEKDLPVINADRAQIHQVMLNLCVNARDAMPSGGSITIKAERQTKIQAQEKFPAANQDTYICITVTDTGGGMDEAIRHKIFDPFFTTKEKGKGTGLGLAVVYGVIQSHHGFIDVESEVGHGTSFQLYFPIPLRSELPPDVSMSSDTFTIGGTETILLVEDEEALREMVRLMLESKGYKVFTAQDGNEAFNVYGQHQGEIDVVLTDMGLPLLTGADVFKKLKEIDPNVNAIFASGFFEPDVKLELNKNGAKGFIQKPYSPNEVLLKLREVLDAKA